MALQFIWSQYVSIPLVTRAYTTAIALTTFAVYMELVSPYDLYFNPHLIITRLQWWRIITAFLYLGPYSVTFMYNIFVICRYSQALEVYSYRGRRSRVVMMYIYCAFATIIIGFFANLTFFGNTFPMMFMYVLSRRNTHGYMNFEGILRFRAQLLVPFVLALPLILGNSLQIDLIGIAVGHTFYFLEDVFPDQPGGFRILITPRILQQLFEEDEDEEEYYEEDEDEDDEEYYEEDDEEYYEEDEEEDDEEYYEENEEDYNRLPEHRPGRFD